MKTEILEQMEGYQEIVQANEVLRKHGVDRSSERGSIEAIVNRLHPRSLKLTLSEIRRETESTSTFRFVSTDGYLPPFQAGQYVNLFVEINGIRTSRPYSVSSAPNQTGYYDLTVRRVEEGFTSNYLLNDLSIGDQLESASPAGQFYHNPLFHGNDLVFIAGGSGITPFMSMIREVTDRGLDRRIHLIYGSRKESDIIFEAELKDRSSRHRNIRFTPVISEPGNDWQSETGFITAELIKKLVGSTGDKMFYLCGPEAMYTFVLAELKKLDIPRRKIRIEVFGPPADVTKQPGWPAEIGLNEDFKVIFNGHEAISAKAGEPLMNSLERHGHTLAVSCRSGECSLCRTKLVSGKVYHPAGAKIRKSDRKYGYIHPCLAYPISDLELIL